MVSNEYEQLSSEALEAARICANKYVLGLTLNSQRETTGVLSQQSARANPSRSFSTGI